MKSYPITESLSGMRFRYSESTKTCLVSAHKNKVFAKQRKASCAQASSFSEKPYCTRVKKFYNR